ncbi:hypothetical protein NP493_1808g00025 [Ridgeia piscesae]|uniref:Uncharacterized protein n=1 Tax=Ridgeia piscesae TaxID=27915 RepID=A0AAD9N7I3_RIDPI|nr:hypothetical protein NP493_1808g00025 [Ridgeia piscesae]
MSIPFTPTYTPPRVDHDDVIDLTSESEDVDASVNVSSDEDEEDNRRRQAVLLESKLKACFAEHVAHLIIQLARCSCGACSIEDPSQLHHVDGCLRPPEELVHIYFVEGINALLARDVFKKWLAVFNEFNLVGASTRQNADS